MFASSILKKCANLISNNELPKDTTISKKEEELSQRQQKTGNKDMKSTDLSFDTTQDSFSTDDKENMNKTITIPKTNEQSGTECSFSIDSLIDKFGQQLKIEFPNESLRSSSETTFDQSTSNYSSTISMDSLPSSTSVSQHADPVDITNIISSDMTTKTFSPPSETAANIFKESTQLPITPKPGSKFVEDSSAMGSAQKSNITFDDLVEQEELFGDSFDLDQFLPLSSKLITCIPDNDLNVTPVSMIVGEAGNPIPLEEYQFQEEAAALPIDILSCEQEFQSPSSQKSRKSVLSHFDPYYLCTPKKVDKHESLEGSGDLQLLETKPNNVIPIKETKEESFSKDTLAPVLEKSLTSDSDVTITPDPVVPAVSNSGEKECSNLPIYTPEVTKRDVNQESPVENPVAEAEYIPAFAKELVAEIIADAVHIIDTSIPRENCFVVSAKTMADVSDKLALQEEENAELKLQLNASQQVRATLELQLRQKEEIIIKSQAEALRKDQAFKQEIKQLKEKLEEKCLENDNSQSKDLQETVKNLKAREAKLVTELNARKNGEQNYRKVMEEYEKNIAEHLSELQKLSEENESVKRHLANLELAFSDVHQKYERSKKIIDGYKCNEDALRERLGTSEDTVIKSGEKYESLKAHAKAQIEKSNQEMQVMREEYEVEIHKLSAIIRRLEIKNASLTDSLDQKTKECSALAALCDEMTGKV